jgi:hypothetical protein
VPGVRFRQRWSVVTTQEPLALLIFELTIARAPRTVIRALRFVVHVADS